MTDPTQDEAAFYKEVDQQAPVAHGAWVVLGGLLLIIFLLGTLVLRKIVITADRTRATLPDLTLPRITLPKSSELQATVEERTNQAINQATDQVVDKAVNKVEQDAAQAVQQTLQDKLKVK